MNELLKIQSKKKENKHKINKNQILLISSMKQRNLNEYQLEFWFFFKKYLIILKISHYDYQNKIKKMKKIVRFDKLRHI